LTHKIFFCCGTVASAAFSPDFLDPVERSVNVLAPITIQRWLLSVAGAIGPMC
jgi:hypothetical protein